jgi:DNA polymerase III epsilon subunit-like protein
MIILDVETTGVSPNNNSILSIGAVDFSHPEFQFMQECRMWSGASVEEEALKVNGFSHESIADVSKKEEGEIVKLFLDWVSLRDDVVTGGQNVFFDVSFIEAAAKRTGVISNLSRRIVDLHSITYAHMLSSGEEPPLKNGKTALDADTIMKYVGIPSEPRPHIALNGAIWEAEAFSRLIYKKPLFPQFEQYGVPQTFL